ncbi:4Fe-4S binding protein [Neobacillus cucumis]|uniref:4Fe-4S binding protein n=1 Tax=Neobacillus cucumis TaxID=1740721 RepID=UPI00204008CB|nr:4Fe-4S binding protein [Neobacillus cucumis]MCM3724212.1 4Fe-4S binding protein [Neobacillus cucumis]
MSLLVNWIESMHVNTKVTNNCSRKKHLRSSCRTCADACRYGALIITSTSIEIDLEKCNSCGDCIIACPLSAIEGVLETRKFDKASLVYNESYIPTVKELLIYKQRGLTAIRSGSIPLNQNWINVLNKANKILQLFEESPIRILEYREEKRMSRRAFFTFLQKEGKQFAKTMAPAAWKLKANEWKLARYYPGYQFYQVDLDLAQCSFCQLCILFCTQKVFSLEEGFLQVANEMCVNCCDCTDICTEDALHINRKITNKQNQGYPFMTKVCETCGNPFSTFHQEIDSCPICRDRNPEWLSP